MSSRKEQKEALRKEREEREAAAKAAAKRTQMVGYGIAGVLVLAGVIIIVLALAGGGDGPSENVDESVLPGGGNVPEQKVTDLEKAASAAGCELKSFKSNSREHTEDPAENIAYDSDPPTSGKHFVEPTEDGAFTEEPDVKALVHTMEHGRVIVWFKPGLPKDIRANLNALFEEDTYQLVLTPNSTMKYQVAATAWNGDPQPNGTGRLLGCPKMDDAVFDAIRSFKDEHRSNGPEPVP